MDSGFSIRRKEKAMKLLGPIVCVAATVVSAASAQQTGVTPPCASRDAIVERLQAKWGETYTGGGLQSAASVFEIYMSEEHGTWTILRTSPNGIACVMASGTNWLDELQMTEPTGVKG